MKRRKTTPPAPPAPVREPHVRAPDAVRVVVVEASTRSPALRDRLEDHADVDVIAQTSTADETLDALGKLKHRAGTVCVVDLGLPRERGFDLIRGLRERYPSLVVLACSDGSDRAHVARALFMGADGYVETGSSPEGLHDAVVQAHRGAVTLVGVPADWSVPTTREAEPPSGEVQKLTGRELEILTVAAEGLTAKAIGERLALSERTVTTHLANTYKKLGAKNRGEAVAAAMQSGLLDVRPKD